MSRDLKEASQAGRCQRKRVFQPEGAAYKSSVPGMLRRPRRPEGWIRGRDGISRGIPCAVRGQMAQAAWPRVGGSASALR